MAFVPVSWEARPPSRLGLLSRVLGSWAIQLCAVPSSGLAVLEPPAASALPSRRPRMRFRDEDAVLISVPIGLGSAVGDEEAHEFKLR